MESFLFALDSLIEEHGDLGVIGLLGALQFTQHRLAVDMLLDDQEDDDQA